MSPTFRNAFALCRDAWRNVTTWLNVAFNMVLLYAVTNQGAMQQLLPMLPEHIRAKLWWLPLASFAAVQLSAARDARKKIERELLEAKR